MDELLLTCFYLFPLTSSVRSYLVSLWSTTSLETLRDVSAMRQST